MVLFSKTNPHSADTHAAAISLGGRIATSQSFKDLFQDGMALVERAALYLETDGRSQSQHLPRTISLAYTAESMRLTTRLMHIASWLLYQRAVNEGEISPEIAIEEKAKFHFDAQTLSSTGAFFSELPLELQEICLHSLRIQHRIEHLDLLLSTDSHIDVAQERPVDNLHKHLRQAFQIHDEK